MRRIRTSAGLARGHALFVALLGAGLAFRAVTFLAYRPALFSPDSPGYLDTAERWTLPALHPLGYPLFLKGAFAVWDDYAFVPLLQHALGIAIGVALYALLLRLGVRPWLAALAAAPALLDAYQLNVEQYVLSDTLFEAALVGGIVTLLWRRPVPLPLAAMAGALFATAVVTRVVGLVVVVPLVLAAVVLRLGRARSAALAAAFLLPVLGYAAVFKSVNGSFGLTDYGGRYLYGRVVDWVDCSEFSVARHERPLCPGEHRALPWTYQYLWSRRSPLYDLEPPPGQEADDVAGDFAKRAITAQPLTYARDVAADSVLVFAPTRFERRGEFRVSQWQFQTAFPIPGQQPGWGVDPPPGGRHGWREGRVNTDLAGFLRSYQRFGYLPGPVLALCLLAALAALALAGTLRAPIAVLVALSVVLIVGSVASTMFAWRYQLPQLLILPPAGALATTALAAAAGRARRGRGRTAEG